MLGTLPMITFLESTMDLSYSNRVWRSYIYHLHAESIRRSVRYHGGIRPCGVQAASLVAGTRGNTSIIQWSLTAQENQSGPWQATCPTVYEHAMTLSDMPCWPFAIISALGISSRHFDVAVQLTLQHYRALLYFQDPIFIHVTQNDSVIYSVSVDQWIRRLHALHYPLLIFCDFRITDLSEKD